MYWHSMASGLALLAMAGAAMAAPVFKCVDGSGKVTFSQHGCGQAEPHQVLAPSAPRPSGDGPAIKLADPAANPPRAITRRTYNHCGDLTQVDIVHATSHGKVILGMTGNDVKKSWGAPARINRSASGEQWIYPIDEYRSRYLYIDSNGCFTYWN